ncbi:hypothetical protein [Varibaculum vaginae]|uniref:hypothetical protein n=1 Tax=Varibaculum vaginae TaxID=2364797 RepID=UPI0013574764|nr:hypothetical protein [Varibaculum vaginae]
MSRTPLTSRSKRVLIGTLITAILMMLLLVMELFLLSRQVDRVVLRNPVAMDLKLGC